MATTECPDCERHFVGPRCVCGYTLGSGPATTGPWKGPDWMDRKPACTPEDNYRAVQLVQAVLDQEITPEQSQAVLRRMFVR